MTWAHKLAPRLRSASPILLLVIFILVNAGIWWAGPWVEYKDSHPLETVTARLIVCIIFSLSCFTLWGYIQWRRLVCMGEKAERERHLKADPVQVLVERQEQELNGVMQQMKESLQTRGYLYKLPWFLVLGGENAGKTSLINRSGQSFVFSSMMRASGKRSQNPFGFDWWIGDDAVLIDPAGELITQKSLDDKEQGDGERRLWLHFIDWLDRTRSRRPLNGVVLAIDLAELISSPAAGRKAYARLIRARLRDLMESLTTRLPVYITLTKLDMLHGFEPLFRHFNQSQRDEILGFTFSLASVDDHDGWLEEFDYNFNALIARLNACLPKALSQCRDREERASIYSFSRQLAGVEGILREFLADALASDQFSTAALVRGIYMTSVYQQGVPVNAYIDGAARRYGLTASINSAQRSENSTPYFSRSLFSQVIYPEAGLASDSFKVARQKKRLLLLSGVACSLAFMLLLGSWSRYYRLNEAHADAVLNKVSEYNTLIEKTRLNPDAPNVLAPLNTIRSATLEFGFFRDKPRLISDMGLYQGHTIGPEVEETYLNLLSYRYLPILLRRVARDLAESAPGSDEKLSHLRVLRMLVDKSGRHSSFVRDYFAAVWQKTYPGQRRPQSELMQHLEYALEHTDLHHARSLGIEDAERVLAPYDRLIAEAQHELSELPIEQRVYRYLKTASTEVLGAPLDLRLSAGPAKDLVFELASQPEHDDVYQIPRFLTRSGLEQYLVPQSSSVAELALIDSWVLGQSATVEFSTSDKAALRDKILHRYVADYHNTWTRALSAFRLTPFDDINQAVLVLDNLSTSNRPVVRLLNTLADNTRLFPELPDDEAARQALIQSPQYRVASAISDDFTELNQIQASVEGKPVYIEEVMDAVEQLHLYLRDIRDAPDVGKAALVAAQQRFMLKDNDPIYVLERIADGLPKPLNEMVAQMAQESWKVVLKSAIKQLESRWYDEVYLEYQQTLSSRYPIAPRARRQVSINDFERFFGPEGTLNTFYDQQMRMFIEDNADELMRLTDGNQDLIRDDVRSAITRAREIQTAFFNLKGNLDVQFELEPLQMSPDKRRSLINIDGQYVEYAHGPRRAVELVWPNTLRESAESRLTLVPSEVNSSPRSIGFQGPWAFFKLLDSAQIAGSSTSSVDYRFEVDGGEMVYRLQATDSANPFTTQLLKQFALPKTLY